MSSTQVAPSSLAGRNRVERRERENRAESRAAAYNSAGSLIIVFAFGFIIFIHELGHFLTARAVDIRCPQFAIGFGPSLFSFRWRGTNFAVRAFPFGEYVLMNGEEPGGMTTGAYLDTETSLHREAVPLTKLAKLYTNGTMEKLPAGPPYTTP